MQNFNSKPILSEYVAIPSSFFVKVKQQETVLIVHDFFADSRCFHSLLVLIKFLLSFLHDFRRNLDYFTTSLRAAVSQTETDENGGEITVRLPSETIPLVEGKDFHLCFFFITPQKGQMAQFLMS